MTGPCTNGAAATTRGIAFIFSTRGRQSPIGSSLDSVTCGSKPSTALRSSLSNPVMTEITRISTPMPSVTPRIEISVMIETNVRFGLR